MGDRHFYVTIRFAYDPVSIDEYTQTRLEREVKRCIQNGMLTPTREEIVNEYIIEVDEKID